MKNGRDPHWDDPKITSISAARKKAEQAKKATARSEAPGGSIGQWIAGAFLVVMALGMLVWWGRSLMQSLSFAP